MSGSIGPISGKMITPISTTMEHPISDLSNPREYIAIPSNTQAQMGIDSVSSSNNVLSFLGTSKKTDDLICSSSSSSSSSFTSSSSTPSLSSSSFSSLHSSSMSSICISSTPSLSLRLLSQTEILNKIVKDLQKIKELIQSESAENNAMAVKLLREMSKTRINLIINHVEGMVSIARLVYFNLMVLRKFESTEKWKVGCILGKEAFENVEGSTSTREERVCAVNQTILDVSRRGLECALSEKNDELADFFKKQIDLYADKEILKGTR